MANVAINALRRSNMRKKGPDAPGQYKKVRLTCSNPTSASVVNLAELQIRPTPGVAVSMADGTATAQSVTGSNVAGRAIDGNNGSAWTSGVLTTTQWWMVEFATERDFEQLYLYPGGSTHWQGAPRTIVVEASEDGTTFTTLGTWTVSAWAQGVAQTWNVH